MKFMSPVTFVFAAAVSFISFAGDGEMSNSAFVFLEPEKSSFWQTATNNVIELPVCYPEGASSATLTVSGIGYSKTYENITGDSVEVTLPAVERPSDENVYVFELKFSNEEVITARLGLVQGIGKDGEGSTRCIASSVERKWGAVMQKAVIPIPYGIKAFDIDGGEGDETGLGGAQGWLAIGPLAVNETHDLSMVTADDEEYFATVFGSSTGVFMYLR
jgi:hypothetical protein